VIRAEYIKPVAAGYQNTFILQNSGNVIAWGDNSYGQFGNGNNVSGYNPAPVGVKGTISIAAGFRRTFAVTGGGLVWAWGSNAGGCLGVNSTSPESRRSPVQIRNLTDIICVSSSNNHALVLKSDGTVYGWGKNAHGEVGDGSADDKKEPVQVKGLTKVISISAGMQHSVALKSDGTVWTWGLNNQSQLGVNDCPNVNPTSDQNRQLVPVQVNNLKNVIAISAGGLATVVLKNDGTVWAWGRNMSGFLGSDTNELRVKIPV
jgi:alpha-tubulin suppressor-like RCC1 family protein